MSTRACWLAFAKLVLGSSVGGCCLATVTRLTLTVMGTVKYCLMIMATMLCRGAYEMIYGCRLLMWFGRR